MERVKKLEKQHVKKGYRFRDKKITEDLWLLGKFIKTAGI